MRKLYFLSLFLIVCSGAFAQQKKKTPTPTIQPYSVSNIKLGMTTSDFLSKYTDSIFEETEHNSTRTLIYSSLVINNIDVHTVILKFYKDKLVQLSFKTFDSKMHLGIDAKYGYNRLGETEHYDNGYTTTIGDYGKKNDHYDLFRAQFDNGDPDLFIMQDIKGVKQSEAEGF